jgi:hypothetical protein
MIWIFKFSLFLIDLEGSRTSKEDGTMDENGWIHFFLENSFFISLEIISVKLTQRIIDNQSFT